jgi:hypothetical protein
MIKNLFYSLSSLISTSIEFNIKHVLLPHQVLDNEFSLLKLVVVSFNYDSILLFQQVDTVFKFFLMRFKAMNVRMKMGNW